MTLPTNHTPFVILGGQAVDNTMPRLLVKLDQSGGGGGGATTQVSENFFTVNNAASGYPVGTVLKQVEVLDLSSGAILSETWYNSAGATITKPNSAYVDLQSAAPLTNAQLTAQGLGKDTTLQSILTAIKAQGGEIAVIDSAPTPVIWTMVLDTATSPAVVTYYQFGTTTVGTPTFPVKPYEYVAGSVSVTSSALPTGAATEATQTAIRTRDDDSYATGTVTSSTPSQFLCEGKGTVMFQVTGTWVGTIVVEYSPDGVTWYPTTYVAVTSGGISTSFSANTGGTINTVGFDYVRLRSSTISSGTANVAWFGSRLVGNVMLDNALPAGSNTIGKVQIDALTNGTQQAKLVDASGNVATITTTGLLNVNQAGSSFSYSTNNSTNGSSTVYALANGATWNGTIENAINQTNAIIGVISNQNVTLTVSQFLDAAGTIKDVPDKTYSVVANTPLSLDIAVLGNYLKLSVTNASGSAANIYVDTYYGNVPVLPDALSAAGNLKTAIQEALPTGTNVIGKTGIDQTTYGTTNAVYVGGTSQSQVTPAVTVGAYSAGNVVGGLISFGTVVNSTVLSGVIESMTVAAKINYTGGFKLNIFASSPSTTFTDKTAPAITTADTAKWLDEIVFSSAVQTLGTNCSFYKADNIGSAVVLAGTTLYGVLTCTGTPTFATTSDVVVTTQILKD